MQTRRTRYGSRDPQLLSRRGLSTLLASLGLIFFHATTTLAADSVLTTTWSDGFSTAEVKFFFDPAGRSEVGVIPGLTAVAVERVDLQLSVNLFEPQTTNALSDPPAPYQDGTIVAVYNGGIYDHIETVIHGGTGIRLIFPTTFFNGEHIRFSISQGLIGNIGGQRLTYFRNGQIQPDYLITSQTGPVLVNPPLVPALGPLGIAILLSLLGATAFLPLRDSNSAA